MYQSRWPCILGLILQKDFWRWCSMDNTGTKLLYSEPPITYRLAKDHDLVRANKILNGLFDGHNFLLCFDKGIL